jgi:hypothetical protein
MAGVMEKKGVMKGKMGCGPDRSRRRPGSTLIARLCFPLRLAFRKAFLRFPYEVARFVIHTQAGILFLNDLKPGQGGPVFSDIEIKFSHVKFMLAEHPAAFL